MYSQTGKREAVKWEDDRTPIRNLIGTFEKLFDLEDRAQRCMGRLLHKEEGKGIKFDYIIKINHSHA